MCDVLKEFVCSPKETILGARKIIDKNKKGFVIVIDEHEKAVGI